MPSRNRSSPKAKLSSPANRIREAMPSSVIGASPSCPSRTSVRSAAGVTGGSAGASGCRQAAQAGGQYAIESPGNPSDDTHRR